MHLLLLLCSFFFWLSLPSNADAEMPTSRPTLISQSTDIPTSRPTAAPKEQPPSKAALLWKTIATDIAQGRGIRFGDTKDLMSLALHLRAQFRYEFVRDLPSNTSLHAFQVRRARVRFSGHAFQPWIRYYVQLGLSPQDALLDSGVVTLPPLRDWYLDIQYLRDLSLRLGQYKVAFNRERFNSSSNLLFVQRSTVNDEFNLDRDLGLDLRSDDLFGLGVLRYRLGVTVGEGHSRYELNDLGVMPLIRLDWFPFGFFDDEHMNDFARRASPALALGASYAYLMAGKYIRGVRGFRYADGGSADLHNACVELLFKWRGISLFGAWMMRLGDYNPGPRRDPQGQPLIVFPRNGHGIVAHLAYLFPRIPFEFGLRYGGMFAFQGIETSLEEQHEFAAVTSYYFFFHSLKLQFEYAYIAPADLARGQHQFRLQLQSSL